MDSTYEPATLTDYGSLEEMTAACSGGLPPELGGIPVLGGLFSGYICPTP